LYHAPDELLRACGEGLEGPVTVGQAFGHTSPESRIGDPFCRDAALWLRTQKWIALLSRGNSPSLPRLRPPDRWKAGGARHARRG